MKTLDANTDLKIRMLKDFLCAGSSAFLVAIAQLHPEFRFLSLLALVPFLWRATRVHCLEASCLGVLLAMGHGFITHPAAAWLASPDPWHRLLFFSLAFGGYAAAVNRLARRIGFQAVLVAGLWLPIEYALGRYGSLGRLFTLAETDSSLLFQVGSLCGTLMISFMVVLTNTLILTISCRVLGYPCFRFGGPPENKQIVYVLSVHSLLEKPWFKFSESRAPPARPEYVP